MTFIVSSVLPTSILRERHAKSKPTQVLNTKWGAQPAPQTQASSHVPAAHQPTAGSPLRGEERQMPPAAAAASEYRAAVCLLLCLHEEELSALCSPAPKTRGECPVAAPVRDSVPSMGPKGVGQLFSIPGSTRRWPLAPL